MPLVFVPTPLGNLRDITLRALDVLRACDVLVAEDTRVARRLLSALDIPGRELVSYREQNAQHATASILDRARTHLVAVVTDAGMPGISDPGSALIAAARAAGVAVEVLPGPSAALSVALLSGFDLRRIAFEGFAPRTSGARRAAFARALAAGSTSIWFESPQRIGATLADIAAVAPDARVFLLREYTKLHEQQVLGTAREVDAALETPIRGEIAFALEGTGTQAIAPAVPRDEHDVDTRIDELLAQGHPAAHIARTLAATGLGERHALYARAGERKRLRRVGGDGRQ